MKKFLLLLMLVWVGNAGATTYYVATDGNDSTGDGSIGTPWLTIQKAHDSMSAGDTVYIRAGTYMDTETVDTDQIANVIISTDGTDGNYITYRNYPGETAIIDGNDEANEYGIYIKAQYIAIIGLEITDAERGIWMSSCIGSKDDSCAGSTVDAEYCIIANNYIHHNGNDFRECDGTCDEHARGGSGLFAQNYTRNNLFYGNTLSQNGLFDTENYDGNVACNNHDHGIYTAGYEQVAVNNIFFGNAALAIADGNYRRDDDHINKESMYNMLKTANNTIKANRRDAFQPEHYSLDKNNIITGNGTPHCQSYGGYQLIDNGVTIDNSLFYANVATWGDCGDVDAACECDGGVGVGIGVACADICPSVNASANDCNTLSALNYQNADPLFAITAWQVLDITIGSPAIGGGTYLTQAVGDKSDTTTLLVDDARWFVGPHGNLDSDVIRVGGNPVLVSDVDYSTSTITLATTYSWSDNDTIDYAHDINGYPRVGDADIGAFEYRANNIPLGF